MQELKVSFIQGEGLDQPIQRNNGLVALTDVQFNFLAKKISEITGKISRDEISARCKYAINDWYDSNEPAKNIKDYISKTLDEIIFLSDVHKVNEELAIVHAEDTP